MRPARRYALAERESVRQRAVRRLCRAAHRRAGRAGVPWLPDEATPQTPAASTFARLRERTGGHTDPSAPDARAVDRLSRTARRDHAAVSKAPLAKLPAPPKRLIGVRP